MKKTTSLVMAFIILLSAFVFSGCSADISGAENTLKVYFSSLSGFNTKAMQGCVADENNGVGFTTEIMSEEYIQTDNYIKSIESMYKALGQTFEFNINSNEVIDKNTIKFNITFKYANVDDVAVEEVKPTAEEGTVMSDGTIIVMEAENQETKMDKYCREQLEAYIAKNPSMLDLNEIEYSDKAISLIAKFYDQYLQITNRTKSDFDIIVSKRSGSWKIHTEDNKDFFDLLAMLFG